MTFGFLLLIILCSFFNKSYWKRTHSVDKDETRFYWIYLNIFVLISRPAHNYCVWQLVPIGRQWQQARIVSLNVARRWGGGQPLMRGGPLLSGACLTSEHIQTHPWPICLGDDGPGWPNGTKERSCLNFTWSWNKINVQKEFKQATAGSIETCRSADPSYTSYVRKVLF